MFSVLYVCVPVLKHPSKYTAEVIYVLYVLYKVYHSSHTKPNVKKVTVFFTTLIHNCVEYVCI